jgi:hypothetical protein
MASAPRVLDVPARRSALRRWPPILQRSLRWFLLIVVAGALVAVAVNNWETILLAIQLILGVAFVIAFIGGIVASALRSDSSQGPPAWWWAEQAEQRRQAEHAEWVRDWNERTGRG